MARDSFDESKNTKKKVTKKKTEEKKPQSSSVTKPKTTTTKADKVASKSTFLGGGAPVQKVEQTVSKPTTVKKPANTKKQTVTKQDQINQKMYGTTKPNVTTKTQRTKRDTKPVTSSQRKANAEANMNLKQRNIRDTAPVQSRRTATTTAAQRQKNAEANLNLKQTQITTSSRQNKELARETGRDFRNAITDNGAKISKEDDRRARQNQKSGIKSRNETLGIKESATGLTIEGSLRQSIGGHLKSIGDDSNEYQEYKDMLDDGVANGRFTRAEANRALESWMKHSNRFDRYKGWENTKQHETYQKIFKKGEEIYDKGTQQVQSAQEGAGRLKKAYLGALGSGVGMATDMAAGPAWMAAMTSRTYGGEIGNAEKEGATRLEDRRYAGLQALKEVGTEGMFSAIGLSAGLLKGRGLFDSFANRLTGRVGESGIRSALRRYGMGIAEENLEEVAGWALDPAIKNLSYGNALWERQSRQTTRDEGEELRNAIASMDKNSVRAMAAHLNSNKYLKQISDEMIANGATKEEASKMALAMQGYMNAVLSNNKEEETAYEDRMVELLKGSNPYKAKLSPSELWDTLSSTTLLTGVTGLGGAVSTAAMGNAIKESNGLGFVKSMSDVVKLFDVDNSVKGQAVSDHIAAGNDVAGTQVSDISDKFRKVKAEGEERYNVSNQLKDRNMKRENLLIQPRQQNPDGTYSLGKITDFAYDEYIKEALDFIENSGLDVSQEEAEQIADAYGAYKTGVINPDQMFVVNTDNPVARTVFSELADINFDSFTVRDRKGNVDIARTNIATENALYAKAADNYLGYARLEQENWNDEARGQVQKAMSERGQQTMSNTEKVDGHGDIAMTNALETVDPRDRGKFMLMATAASNVYNDARYRNIEWDEAKYEYREMYKGLDQNALKEVFDAAKTDKINAETKNYGMPVKSGSTMNKQSLQDVGPVRVPGKVLDMREDQSVKLSEKSFYYTAAPIFGSNITLVDNLPMRDAEDKIVYRNIETGEQINEDRFASLNESDQQLYIPVQLEGSQSSTGIVLNTNAGIRRNVEDIAKHETIHQIRTNAPEQFKALARYLQDAMYSADPEGFMRTIEAKQKQYKAAGQDLTIEGAMEELIAEGGVNIDWDQLIEDIQTNPNVQEKRTLLEAIRDAFREVIAKLRALLSSGNITSEEARSATLDELLRMDEGYKLLVNAAYAAKVEEADQAIADWQDKANKQNAPRLSVGEEKYSITTDKEDFIKGANLSKDLRDWAKEMGLDKLSKQPIKGPVIVSVRDLRTAWYEKNGRTDEANVINTALDKIGDSLTQLVGEYQYIDLGDALNAAVTYRTDAEGHPTSVILSCQVKNAEYEVNFDFTTICAKRLAMQKILERFIKTEGERQGTTLYDELKLDEEGLYKLRLILETAGFEVSCRGCFVEQNRYSQQNQARTIANDWNAALDAWAKENGTEVTENFGLTTLDIDNLDYEEIEAGFERYHELMKGKKTDVATKNRMLIEASPFFRKRMNASDYASMTGQRALMAIGESKKGGTNLYGLLKRGQSDSKQSVPFTAYNGEISLLPDNMKGKSLYDYLLSIGGARAQSASDFQIEFVYDYMQMVADLSARGLPMHMYTKVIELAELFGMTGIKINLSAMCDVAEDVGGEYAGLKLVDGKYEYNISDQSIDYEKAVELQKRDGYSKNIGIIMVTLSSQHMLKSLDDPDVRYIIGYHSSAMPVVVANMSNMGGATDYTKINKTNKLNEKGQALFDEAMAEAKGNTELEKYKDALRIFDEKIQEETAKKKKKPRRGNEYGAYMSAYGNNTADFNTYDILLETKDARKTADKYLEHCMENDLIPIYFPFAFHENYYKCEVYDFNMYDNNTGEYAPMEGVQNIYPGLNMAAGETDTTAFTDRVSQMMDAQNRTNKALDSQYDAVFDEAKEELKYSITGDDYMDFDASGIDHNELMHRADAPMTAEQQRDADYMAAVNSGNMEEAQRLVDEAAKMAGFDTPLLHHGTPSFGFTTFDLARGENIIFATNNRLTAETYSGETDRNRINEKSNIDTDQLYGQELLDTAKKYLSRYKDYRLMSGSEKEDSLDEARSEMAEIANDVVAGFIAEHRDSFDDEKLETANRIVDALNNISTAWNDDDVQNAWDDFQNAIWDLKWMDESIQLELSREIQDGGPLQFLRNRISDFMYAGDLYARGDSTSEYVYDNQLALELEAELNKGIYGLYGNPGKQLVIDANGSNWNQIIPPDELELYGPQRTRSIAEAAKAKGYDSVLFKDLRDNGGATAYNGESDVYMFFNPNQVKSADPVTYAEDGSVIPLSERFDPTNNDIRYSLPTQDSDGNILTDGQMEYFRNSQARDEQGRLVPVYHTTKEGGFTIFDPQRADDHRSLFFTNSRRMSASYSKRDGRIPSLINPYDATAPNTTINNVQDLPDFGEVDVSIPDVISRISNIKVVDRNGNEVASGDSFVNVAISVGKYLENKGWDLSDDLGVDPYLIDEEHNWGSKEGDAFDLYTALWEADLKYTMDFADPVSTYAEYLNFENPLIIDAKGEEWNSVPYGGNSIQIKNLSLNFTPDWDNTEDGDPLVNGYTLSVSWEQLNESGIWEEKNLNRYFINFEPENLSWYPSEEITAAMETNGLTYGIFNEMIKAGEEEPMDGSIKYESEDAEREIPIYDTTYNTRQIAEIAQNEGYDGVIIRNVIDYGDWGYGFAPADVYIAFSSNQVKDINNENPTENPDIRYSIPSEEEVTAYALDKAESTSDVWYTDPVLMNNTVRYSMSEKDFKNRVKSEWNERRETSGLILDEASVQNDVRSLVKTIMKNSEVNKKYDADVTKKATKAVTDIFKLFKSGKLEEAASYAWDAAEDIVQNVEYVEDDMYQKYKGVITYLADTKIAAPEALMDDEEFSAFVMENLRKFLVKNKGEDISNVYTHLNTSWPKLFPKLDHPVDMFLQIAEVMDEIQPYTEVYSSEEAAKLTEDTAAALVDIAKSGEAYKSAADIMNPVFDRETKALKQRHKEAMSKVRTRRDELIQNEKGRTARQKERADKWKQKYNDRIQRDKEKREEKKERQTHQKLYNKTLKEYKDLTHKLLHPTKDKAKNVPEQLRQPLAHLLYCFDLEKERSKELEEMYMLPTRAQLNFRELKDAMDKVIKEDPTAYELSDVQRYMADKMVDLADRVDGKTIDALDNEDLNTIADLLKGISEGIKNGQQLEIDGENYEKQQQCDKVGTGAYEHQKLYGKAKKYGSNEEPGIRALADHIVNMGELTPIYFFRQIKGIYDMYRQMRKGFDNYVRNEKDIIDKIADILAPYYKTNRKKQRIQGSEIEEWRTLESAETFDLITANQKITLTIAQKMSLYCLAKRKQAQAHMFSENGGVIASEASFGSRMHKAEEKYKGKEIEYKSVVLTPADIETIISTLTEEQKEIADSLQKLMSVDMSELGNKASVKLTGIEMYKEKEYFPIKVQGESLPTDPENIGIREKIRNPGFSNPLQENASNPIIVDDIFTVVASHCNEMNQYASYAVPITNFMKVYNGSVIGEDGKPVKIKTLLKETYGEKALTYIENFIDDINGNSFKRHGGLDDVLDKALGQAKKAAVFANLRVALQQPTAIIRAFAVMKVKYFKGVKPSAAATKEMFEHCPIALWKSWGYYDTHFGRDIEDVMMGKNQPSKADYLMSEAYGWFDNMTWGMIWQAVKNEVRENNPNVEEGSEEFWELCNERASFVFDSTQVVDSPFHRSNDMRSKNGLVKQLTSFQAEPTLSFNVLRQGFVDAYEALKKGDSKKARRLLGRVLMVWVAQALTVALAQSFVDALRRKGKKKKDEEEDEMLAWYQELYKYFLRNFGNNLKDDLNPINNIYYIKDIVPPILNAIKGEYVYGTQSLTTQWVDTLTNGISMCKKKWEKGEADYHTWYDCLTELMGGIGYLAGVPAKTMMRGTKNAFHWVGKILGVNVFADDGEAVDKAVDAFVDNFRGDETESEGGGLLDSIAHKMGYQKKGDKDVASETTSESTMSPDDLPDNLTDEQKADIIKSAERRSKTATTAEDVEKRDYDTMLYDAMKAASGYEGEKYNKKIWESVSKGYKAYVEEGNYERINMMRRVVEEAGGDLDYFDKQVNAASKSALKKSIKPVSDMTEEEYYAQKSILGHLRQSGMSDQEIGEYVYKSDTRTDLQVAMRINDEDAIFEELTALVNAGFTQQDFEKAYKNRNRVNLKNYKDKGGKYSDRLKSMGTFIWPTDGVITSHFGYRNAPTAGASSNHPAIDIGAPQGTAVVAADGGVVISAGANGGYGNSVGIKHDNGMITWYNHLYDWNVKVGDTVAQGQQIAQVGSTGISTGPHLDFKIMDTDGNPVDPEKYLNN